MLRVSTRAAFTRSGPVPPVPRGRSYYTALRLPCSVGRGSGSPRTTTYHGQDACSWPLPRASTNAGALEILGRLPRPDLTVENMGIPVYLGHPLRTCHGHITLRRCVAASPTTSRWRHCCLQESATLGLYRDDLSFGAVPPRPTRSLPYASAAPLPGQQQRLTSGLRGSALTGWNSHPLDDERYFGKGSPVY